VTDLGSWLGERRPPAPSELAAEVATGLGQGEPFASLLSASGRRLDEARARPGRVRDSAFSLLAADALITYACEAALESDDPEGSLRRIVEVGFDR